MLPFSHDHRSSFTIKQSFTVHEAGEGHLIHILELTHQSGTPLGEQKASVLLACVVGRANVLEHRLWSLVLFRELFFTCWEWMGVQSIKHWSWSHILTPTLRWKNDSGAMDGS